MRKGIIGLSLLLTISLIPAYSATPPKAGSICSKQGITKTFQGKRYTCIKSGKKLVWSKGVAVKKSIPSSAPTPSNSPTPTPTPSNSPTPTPTPSPTPTPTPTPTPKAEDSQQDLLGENCLNAGEERITFNVWICVQTDDKGLVWFKKGTEPVRSSQNPTTAPSLTPTPKPSPSSSTVYATSQNSLPEEVCKLRDQSGDDGGSSNVNVGFPAIDRVLRSSEFVVPIKGETEFLLIPVDFSDMAATFDATPYLEEQGRKVEEWYNHFSNGKLKVTVRLSKSWYRSKTPATELMVDGRPTRKTEGANTSQQTQSWNNQPPTYNILNSWAEEMLTIISKDFNFKNVSMIFFYTPSGLPNLYNSAPQFRYQTLDSPQGDLNLLWLIPAGVDYESDWVSAQRKKDKLYALLIHEVLHSQGMALHAPFDGSEFGLDTNQYYGSDVVSMYQQFLVGWTNPRQVYCLDAEKLESSTVVMTPNDSREKGIKAVMIKISEFELLVVESRKPIDFSKEWPVGHEGLLIYKVDVRVQNNRSLDYLGVTGNDTRVPRWSYLISPDGTLGSTSYKSFNEYFIKSGKTLVYKGISISLVQSGTNDVVQIQRAAEKN